MRVSQLNGCAVCLDTHGRAACAAGVEQVRLDVLPAWREVDLFSDVERAALHLAESLSGLDRLSERGEAAFSVAEHLTAEQISAIEWAVILINAFNRVSIASGHQVRVRDE